MNGTALTIAELLAECAALGIRLLVVDSGRLSIDAPKGHLTPELLTGLKVHKADLLARLQSSAEPVESLLNEINHVATQIEASVCRCGSTNWRDVSIHDGQSLRRDCELCGRFIRFPLWHGAILD